MATWDDEENTRPDLAQPPLLRRSLSLQAQASKVEDDDSTLGMLMRQTVNNTRAIEELHTSINTLSREVRQQTRGIESDRPILAKDAAKSSSNRLAVMMGALFTVYEVTAPYVREIWRQLVHR
jgi:hypothetical protein